MLLWKEMKVHTTVYTVSIQTSLRTYCTQFSQSKGLGGFFLLSRNLRREMVIEIDEWIFLEGHPHTQKKQKHFMVIQCLENLGHFNTNVSSAWQWYWGSSIGARTVKMCPWTGQPYFQCSDRVRTLLWVTVFIMHVPFGTQISDSSWMTGMTELCR